MNQTVAPLPVLNIGEYVLDESNARLSRDGKSLDLPPKAYSVLCLLVRNCEKARDQG
jgi:DNA-binding response OmpR family regulator